MSDKPQSSEIGNILVQGGKAVIAHTIIGDVVIQHDAISAALKKRWRPLARFIYPSQNLKRDLDTNIRAHLMFHLHEVYKDAGYTEFTAIVSVAPAETIGDVTFQAVEFITNQPKFLWAYEDSLRKLWNPEFDRKTLQDKMNSTLLELQSTWHVDVQLTDSKKLAAYRFVYDPEGHLISVRLDHQLCGAASDYPGKAAYTSEMLLMIAVWLNSKFLLTGTIETVLHSYPLTKLMLYFLDNRSIDFSSLRVNSENCEEWDYVNAAADEELRRYGIA